jgi:hypothetical protein
MRAIPHTELKFFSNFNGPIDSRMNSFDASRLIAWSLANTPPTDIPADGVFS